MSLDEFGEWIEENHPEHTDLMEEFTQHLNTRYKEEQKIWEKYLDKYGREEQCPNCDYGIFYIMPESWDMTQEDCFLAIPCLGCRTILTISNHKGELKQEFTLVTKLRKGGAT